MLEIIGALFYLINKIFFTLSEYKKSAKLKLWAWYAFLIGVPCWLIILFAEKNYMVACLEAGGIPSVILGVYLYYKKSEMPKTQKFVEYLVYASIVVGILFSLIHYGGITATTQWLEIGSFTGFLLGNYYMSVPGQTKKGFGWFMVMNLTTATLMYIQQRHFLAAQQMVSFIVVLAGLVISLKNNNEGPS